MKKKWSVKLLLIWLITLAAAGVNWFRPLKMGLDLQGGAHLVLETDMSQIDVSARAEALNSVKEVIGRRVDLYGVAEPLIQTAQVGGSDRLIVELPGIEDIDQAVALIGQTAQLDFRESLTVEASASAMVFSSTGLTGKDLKKAGVSFAGSGVQSGQAVVDLEFTADGAKKFAGLTQANVGKPLAIFLDDQLVTAPIVNEPILDGRAQISGNFDADSASQLAVQLNAGALPVPVKIIAQKNISATLGAASIDQSLKAGVIGLVLVSLFMVSLYRLPGLIAVVGLIIYGLITLSLYRLIPVTLTLPGIAGLILSVGMAVDSNILIFERFKEERRAGRPFRLALELAFGRAWDAIKDANITTIAVSLILINPFNLQWLNTSGMVRGFALTLLLGVLTSLFTGIFVTRTLMRQFLSKRYD
ncbi:protein translocase subunit SecD [Candidatus Beckwithbacteria bacterium CG22_combo_CG10-13_8_21_14_all_01_47_9]|uniref:Protein translocase subunit SecD n=3 Tax=Candidatus Beckwithiibacteriota TaxID=1752726 RepID=A0A2H0E219_9BACT|nr:MAG: protein-export membrane protein SecD [Candidatus Beckwithbacteria bacterium CG1_02_47_37]PIP88486.1 MAG: protein translocase subunit SecD [Candidatus Beckwithbacteria bacterium CG22_combo_CG10-13_8_21_14_all_01_47_9]PJC66688.1 MAG: protein translocase subunit SecD [Candidatus Beckwithbacteria bacterium CG_4_9_14_0_2_um_filter_47_11]